MWGRSSHSRLVDVSLNASLRTITGCLRPTQVDQLPVLAEIAPPALRQEAATLVLGQLACQHDHLLHRVMENSTHRKRLKSRRPLTHHAQQLVSSVHPQETVTHLTQARWTESWASTTKRLPQIHAHTINEWTGCGSIPTSLDPAKQATDSCWQIWGKHAALGTVHERQL